MRSIKKCSMIYKLELFFIFYLTPSIRAINIRIDGKIDFGPNWGYEYRVLREESQPKRDSSDGDRSHKTHHEASDDDHGDEERRDREIYPLRQGPTDTYTNTGNKFEYKLDKVRTNKMYKPVLEGHSYRQNPVDNVKDKIIIPTIDKYKNQIQDKIPKYLQSIEEKQNKIKAQVPYMIPEIPEQFLVKNKPESNIETTYTEKTVKIKRTTPKPVTFSSAEDSSEDSSMRTTKKPGTLFDVNDFTTTKKHRTPKILKEYMINTKKEKKSNVNKDEDNSNRDIESIIKGLIAKPSIGKDNNGLISNTVAIFPTVTTKPTTTLVTTVRTSDIYNEPHKVQDDPKVVEFTNHIYKQTLKVLDIIKEKTNEYHLKKQVDVVAKNYANKFKDFLRETRNQKIKTRLGTQKVVLNTIDMSNRILKRLTNFMMGDLDKRGILRHNMASAKIFLKEFDKEKSLEMGHACKKFGICRTGNGLPKFLVDVILIILGLDNARFIQTRDAFTEVVKNTDFSDALEADTAENLKTAMGTLEQMDVFTLRVMIMIFKNIIVHKNMPLIISSESAHSQINSTLALLEIIDLLDQNMPNTEANNLEWDDIKQSLSEYSDGMTYDVQDIMETMVQHFTKVLKNLDPTNRKIISHNMNIVLGKA